MSTTVRKAEKEDRMKIIPTNDEYHNQQIDREEAMWENLEKIKMEERENRKNLTSEWIKGSPSANLKIVCGQFTYYNAFAEKYECMNATEENFVRLYILRGVIYAFDKKYERIKLFYKKVGNSLYAQTTSEEMLFKFFPVCLNCLLKVRCIQEREDYFLMNWCSRLIKIFTEGEK